MQTSIQNKLLHLLDTDEVFNSPEYKEWVRFHEPKYYEIDTDQYFNNFWADNAPFGFEKHLKLTGVWDTKKSNWVNDKMNFSAIHPVHGMPFCRQTDANKVITQIKRTPNISIIYMDSKTVQAPYSETFTIREMWTFISLPDEELEAIKKEHNCEDQNVPRSIFIHTCFINFVKSTIFKFQIRKQALAGTKDVALQWFTQVPDELFKQPSKPVKLPVEKPQQQLIQLVDDNKISQQQHLSCEEKLDDSTLDFSSSEQHLSEGSLESKISQYQVPSIQKPCLSKQKKMVQNITGKLKGETECSMHTNNKEDLLGPSLKSLFEANEHKLDFKSNLTQKCCVIGQKMIRAAECLHSKGLIHSDIKPQNFCVSKNDTNLMEDEVYLLDFGLSKIYKNNGVHVPSKEGQRPISGFSSLNTINGIKASRRDDLESIGLVLISFIKGNKLPWITASGASKTDVIQCQQQKITLTKIEELCKDLPFEFMHYMTYCRQLKFEEEPNYDYLVSTFQNCLKWLEIQNSHISTEELPLEIEE